MIPAFAAVGTVSQYSASPEYTADCQWRQVYMVEVQCLDRKRGLPLGFLFVTSSPRGLAYIVLYAVS